MTPGGFQERLVGQAATGFKRPSLEYIRTLCYRPVHKLGGEPGLADARLAFERHCLGLALAGRVKGRGECDEFAPTANKGRFAEGCHAGRLLGMAPPGAGTLEGSEVKVDIGRGVEGQRIACGDQMRNAVVMLQGVPQHGNRAPQRCSAGGCITARPEEQGELLAGVRAAFHGEIAEQPQRLAGREGHSCSRVAHFRHAEQR
jgi:hypothetical protein